MNDVAALADVASRPNALFDAAGMQAIDNWAINTVGVPSLELMETAGVAVADAVMALDPDGPVRIVAGKGNNGGDGLVAARVLADRGFDVEVLSVFDPAGFTPDTAAMNSRWGGPLGKVDDGGWEAALAGSDVIVDALFGTGFKGAPEGTVAEVIDAVNHARLHGARVVAADMPSGIDASDGTAAGVAVEADVTVTFHASKPGHWIFPGKFHTGDLEVVDIGIPPFGTGEPPAMPVAELLDGEVLSLLPARGPQSTKFTSGQVVVAGGSAGLSGAVCLAAAAAMRSGAGYVRMVVPAELAAIVDMKLTEAMTVVLEDADTIVAEAERAGAVVLGSGAGREPEVAARIRAAALAVATPLVLDADGLNAFAAEGGLSALADRAAPTVLTPHEGELARLLGTSSDEVRDRRLAAARQAAEQAGAVLVLKGDDTIVVDGVDGYLAIAAGDSPALATAGTGDVLAGIVAALIGRGLDAFDAACGAVWLQQEAGRIAADRVGNPESVIAGDVVEAIGAAFAAATHPEGCDCGSHHHA